jgi:hypothetical protein
MSDWAPRGYWFQDCEEPEPDGPNPATTMSNIYRVHYRLSDEISAERQPQRAGSLRVTATSTNQAAKKALAVINIMRGGSFKPGEIIIDKAEREDKAITVP